MDAMVKSSLLIVPHQHLSARPCPVGGYGGLARHLVDPMPARDRNPSRRPENARASTRTLLPVIHTNLERISIAPAEASAYGPFVQLPAFRHLHAIHTPDLLPQDFR